VLACNTISTLLLPELRACFDVPFVGVVPAIKPAARLSKTKRVGLLATPGTVKRPYTDQLIEDYASDCEVVRVGSSELVTQAENLLSGRDVSEVLLASILAPFEVQTPVDTVVLGCTHFPLLRGQLSKVLPGVIWVDSGEAIAKRVITLLASYEIPSTVGPEGNSHQLYFSGTKPDSAIFSQALIGLGITRHQLHSFTLSASAPS